MRPEKGDSAFPTTKAIYPETPPPPPVATSNAPAYDPGTKRQAKWFTTVQDGDVMFRGTQFMDAMAGENDPLAIHTSKYLATVAVPNTLVASFISRNVLPPETVSSSFRMKIPFPGIKDTTMRAAICPSDEAQGNPTCNAKYITLLKHTYEWLEGSGKLTDARAAGAPHFAVFVPFEDNRIRWTAKEVYAKEKMEVMDDKENTYLIALLLVALIVCCFLR